MSPPAAATAASTVSASEAPARLQSLDVLRGLVIVGMITVNSAAYLKYVGGYPAYGVLMHAHWAGFTLADAVFPAFVFMVGVSIPWSLARARAAGLAGEAAGKILWRSLRLILIGVLVSNLYWFADFESGTFRPMGVLQRLGLVYLACALLFLSTGPRLRLGIALGVLLAYWPLLLMPPPDGSATDLHQRGLNFAAWFDRAVLGPHLYVKGPAGYDPEGLLSTLPAIAQGLLGVAVGEALRLRRPSLRTAGGLAVVGGLALALGLAWSPLLPIVKDIWSSSFVLVSTGAALLVLALLHTLLDVTPRRSQAAGVFAVFGINAIAAYVLHILASGLLEWDALRLAFDGARVVFSPEAAALAPVAVFIFLLWCAMAYLARRGWYFRV